jgi:oxygen-independent coproporphyrinogen-3 oxidase
MYRQKNTVGNLENVGFSIEGHEGHYNIYMMDEVQTIFAVGAGAVTKLVKCEKPFSSDNVIKRLFNPKYPYEYLRVYNEGDISSVKESFEREVLDFFDTKE